MFESMCRINSWADLKCPVLVALAKNSAIIGAWPCKTSISHLLSESVMSILPSKTRPIISIHSVWSAIWNIPHTGLLWDSSLKKFLYITGEALASSVPTILSMEFANPPCPSFLNLSKRRSYSSCDNSVADIVLGLRVFLSIPLNFKRRSFSFLSFMNTRSLCNEPLSGIVVVCCCVGSIVGSKSFLHPKKVASQTMTSGCSLHIEHWNAWSNWTSRSLAKLFQARTL